MAHHFGAAGYDTGYIGKWHLADNDDGPVEPAQRGGYDDWLASNALEFTSDDYHTTVFNNDGRPVHLPGYRVDALTDAAIRYLDRHRKNPFYLFLSFLEPHHQNHLDNYPAPMGYAEKYAGRWVPPDLAALGGSAHQHLGGYFGMVKRLDEALGRLQDALISLDLWDNTVLLFSSDHACHFKTRNTEYKRSCHESSIRVPTALHGAMFEGGGRIKQLVSLIDLPPTLLDAAGLPVPPEMQGRSLVPLVESRDFDWPEEVFIQVSETEVGRAIRTHRWKYGVVAPDKNPVADAGSDTYSEEYLYDLLADPYELVDLSGLVTHREATDVLRERLIRRMVAAGEEAPRIRPAPPRPGGQRVVSSAEAHA